MSNTQNIFEKWYLSKIFSQKVKYLLKNLLNLMTEYFLGVWVVSLPASAGVPCGRPLVERHLPAINRYAFPNFCLKICSAHQ